MHSHVALTCDTLTGSIRPCYSVTCGINIRCSARGRYDPARVSYVALTYDTLPEVDTTLLECRMWHSHATLCSSEVDILTKFVVVITIHLWLTVNITFFTVHTKNNKSIFDILVKHNIHKHFSSFNAGTVLIRQSLPVCRWYPR